MANLVSEQAQSCNEGVESIDYWLESLRSRDDSLAICYELFVKAVIRVQLQTTVGPVLRDQDQSTSLELNTY